MRFIASFGSKRQLRELRSSFLLGTAVRLDATARILHLQRHRRLGWL